MAMAQFAGLDVSVKETSVCVVDDAGTVLCERKVATEPDDIATLLGSVGGDYVRVGIGRPSVAMAGRRVAQLRRANFASFSIMTSGTTFFQAETTRRAHASDGGVRTAVAELTC